VKCPAVQHFHEKLREVHGMYRGYAWVKTPLQEGGLVRTRNKPGSHRKHVRCTIEYRTWPTLAEDRLLGTTRKFANHQKAPNAEE
jgi:hypothetical protein